jgi:hypothetical protein
MFIIKPKRHIFSAVNVGESIVIFAEDKWLLDLLWNRRHAQGVYNYDKEFVSALQKL